MAFNAPMKLLLLAALVAMTAASLDVPTIDIKKLSKVDLASPANLLDARANSATSPKGGNRKLLSGDMQTVRRPDAKVVVSKGTKSDSVALLNAKVSLSGNDRKLMNSVRVANSQAVQLSAHKAKMGLKDRKLMAVHAGAVNQAPTTLPTDSRVAVPDKYTMP